MAGRSGFGIQSFWTLGRNVVGNKADFFVWRRWVGIVEGATCDGMGGVSLGAMGAAVGVATGGVGVDARLRRMSERFIRVATSLSVCGARGEPGEGFLRAWRMSRTPAMMRLVDEASGMVTCSGNQARVLAMCSLEVLHTQVR